MRIFGLVRVKLEKKISLQRLKSVTTAPNIAKQVKAIQLEIPEQKTPSQTKGSRVLEADPRGPESDVQTLTKYFDTQNQRRRPELIFSGASHISSNLRQHTINSSHRTRCIVSIMTSPSSCFDIDTDFGFAPPHLPAIAVKVLN
jgi:hypothetical protein